MPGNEYGPIPAILSQVDWRAWSGQEVLTRGGVATELPEYGDGEGIYEDALSALNGRGVYPGTDADSDIAATGTGAGTSSVALLASDRIQLGNDGEGFTVKGDAAAVWWGFPSTDTASAFNGVGWDLTATADWARGNIYDQRLTITPATGAAFRWPSVATRIQDVPTFFRATGVVGDVDDLHDPAGTFASLEGVEATAHSPGVRWGLDERGHAYTSWPQSLGLAAPVWTSTSFRDRLGFSGLESAVTTSTRVWVIAEFPMPGVYVPTRQLTRIERLGDEVSSAIRRSDGGYAGQYRGFFNGWRFEFFVDGPADPRSTWLHWMERVVPYLGQSRRVTLYQEWGDPRRRLGPYGLVDGVDAYSTLHTSEFEGGRGRIRGRVVPGELSRLLAWPGRTRRRVPVTMTIADAED